MVLSDQDDTRKGVSRRKKDRTSVSTIVYGYPLIPQSHEQVISRGPVWYLNIHFFQTLFLFVTMLVGTG